MKIIIFDFNRTLYAPEENCLVEGAINVLERLQENNILFLLGKGDEKRKEIISSLNIAHFFEEMFIVPEKNIEQLEYILKKHPEVSEIYSVGDRIKKEIKLGNMLGIKTIWVRNGKFADETPSSKAEEPWKTVNHLAEIHELTD